MELPEPTRWNEINDVLAEVRAHPGADRSAVLRDVCGNDAALRRAVKTLLDADATYGGLLDEGAAALARPFLSSDDATTTETAAALEPGRRVDAYRLMEQIGRGGTSVVYRAKRADDQFDRTVAIKVLRGVLGRETETRERFQAERQILASLSHPHLAEVYDGGVLRDGRPYLVMEYVDGRPLTAHCRAEACSVDERLALFRQAAEAVQAAHEQLVVHRDLKPSNVLVERDTGQVKLLDFGIAKMLGELPGPSAPTTQTGRQPMTPAYAAPEQVKGETISVATDTYALGVLLYELLTGTRPHGGEHQSPYAVARAVSEDDPPRPSTLADDPDRRAALAGDLERIVMTALQKAPADRYDTVDDLIDDLDRYRTDRPVRAQQGGWTYRARKFVRRNQRFIGGAVAGLLVLVGVMFYHTQRLAAERNEARQEAEKAEQVVKYLSAVFEASDPAVSQGQPPTVSDVLDQGRRRIRQLDDQPDVQAELMGVLGGVYRSLGHFDEADSLLKQRVELERQLHDDNHPSVAAGLADLALLRRKTGDLETADSLHRRALRIRRNEEGPVSAETATSLNDLAVVLEYKGKLKLADSLYQEALRVRQQLHGPNDPNVAAVLDNRASILKKLGRYETAEQLQRRAVSMWTAAYDGPHPDLSRGLHDLAGILADRGKFQAADSLYQRSLAIDGKLYDEPHPQVAQTLNNLGVLRGKQGQSAAADSFLTHSLRIRRQTLPEGHPRIAESLNNLARLKIETGQYDGARGLLREALVLDSMNYGAEHPYVAGDLANLGNVLRKQGQTEKAASKFRKSLSVFESALPQNHPRTTKPLMLWGRMLLDEGRPAEAKEKFERVLDIRTSALSEGHYRVATAKSALGACVTTLGDYERAEDLLRSAYDTLLESRGESATHTVTTERRLRTLYEAWGRPQRAKSYQPGAAASQEGVS
jgi:serine/threonine-protein kinase